MDKVYKLSLQEYWFIQRTLDCNFQFPFFRTGHHLFKDALGRALGGSHMAKIMDCPKRRWGGRETVVSFLIRLNLADVGSLPDSGQRERTTESQPVGDGRKSKQAGRHRRRQASHVARKHTCHPSALGTLGPAQVKWDSYDRKKASQGPVAGSSPSQKFIQTKQAQL